MVNNYLLGAVLGEGSQGKVREALHAVTLRRVAIKRLKLQQLRKLRNAEASLRRELAIHRRLKHKHVAEPCVTICIGYGAVFLDSALPTALPHGVCDYLAHE